MCVEKNQTAILISKPQNNENNKGYPVTIVLLRNLVYFILVNVCVCI